MAPASPMRLPGAAGNRSNPARRADLSGHVTGVRRPGRDRAGTVRTHQRGRLAPQVAAEARHVADRDACRARPLRHRVLHRSDTRGSRHPEQIGDRVPRQGRPVASTSRLFPRSPGGRGPKGARQRIRAEGAQIERSQYRRAPGNEGPWRRGGAEGNRVPPQRRPPTRVALTVLARKGCQAPGGRKGKSPSRIRLDRHRAESNRGLRREGKKGGSAR